MAKAKRHQRVNDILLGPLERPALKWLAAHMPAWVTPDICTFIGVMGAIIITVGYSLSRLDHNFLWLASLGFIINWFGDSLDGTLARFRGIERPIYGFFVDHITDAASQVIIFVGLGISPYVNFSVACLALIAYLLLSVLVYVRTYVAGEFKISYGRLGPTEIRAIAILLNVSMYFFGSHTFTFTTGFLGLTTVSIYDLAVAAIAALLFFFFIFTATQEILRLRKNE